jgi:hypothetical protein
MKSIPSTDAARPAPGSGVRLSVSCDWNATIKGGKRQTPNTSIITATAEDGCWRQCGVSVGEHHQTVTKAVTADS